MEKFKTAFEKEYNRLPFTPNTYTEWLESKMERIRIFIESDILDVDNKTFYMRGALESLLKIIPEEYCECENGGTWLDGYYDTHCDICKKRLK